MYFTREIDAEDNGGRLNFINFETHRIDICINFIRQLKEEHAQRNGKSELCVVATGGGAFKFYDKLKEALDVNILREEEMECLIIGEFRSTEGIGKWTQTHRGCNRPGLLHHRNSQRGLHLQ